MSDLSSNQDFGFIPWSHIYSYIPQISSLIEKEELYLYNLPDNKKEKELISINSISLDASAFEFEFNKLYKNNVSFLDDIELRKKAKEKAKNFANSLPEEKERNIILNCLGNILIPSLTMKNQKALQDYSFVIKELCNDLGFQNGMSDISTEFVSKRHAIDHGLENMKITSKTANAYFLERILIYSMQLKRIGMSYEEIIYSIKIVFELFRYF